jgi:serine/threonine protein kinase
MKSIQVTKFKSTELNPEFNSVKSFEIEDKPFDSGAFGEVYFCNSVNGVRLQSTQVLKIFLDDGSGSAKRGFETITKLQEQIISHNLYLKQCNEKPIEQINALGALPQFSYEGVLNGNKVLGYSANLLNKSEWLLFGNIFNEEDLQKRKELRNKFYNIALDHRLKMAFDLAEGFSHLGQMKFIYADLNPKNFFVNENEGQLCLIDFEGGAVNENPETYGKPGEWLAPEIQEQLLKNNSPIIKVDLNTDTWAVAIGIHFMLFHFHPLFFLKVRGKKEMNEYFKKYQWPNIDKNHSNFRHELEGIYDIYIDKLQNQIPKEIFKAFSDTINRGYSNPNLRLSYKQWINAIKGLMLPPSISKFEADNSVIIDGIPVLLSWDIDSKAHTVTIDNGIGDVTGMNEIRIRPEKNTTYTLKVIGHFGESEKSIYISVFPTPVIKTLHIPTPIFNHQTSISNFKIETPQINLGIDLNPNIFVPNTIDFEKLNSNSRNFFFQDQKTINPISEVFEIIQDRISHKLKQIFTK